MKKIKTCRQTSILITRSFFGVSCFYHHTCLTPVTEEIRFWQKLLKMREKIMYQGSKWSKIDFATHITVTLFNWRVSLKSISRKAHFALKAKIYHLNTTMSRSRIQDLDHIRRYRGIVHGLRCWFQYQKFIWIHCRWRELYIN